MFLSDGGGRKGGRTNDASSPTLLRLFLGEGGTAAYPLGVSLLIPGAFRRLSPGRFAAYPRGVSPLIRVIWLTVGLCIVRPPSATTVWPVT